MHLQRRFSTRGRLLIHTYIHTYIHTNLYSANIVERIRGAGTGCLGGKSGQEEMRCAVVLTQYRRVTDRQTDRRTDRRTDGIAVANTALAMRALRAL